MITQEKLLQSFHLALFRTGMRTGIIHTTKIDIVDYDDGLFVSSVVRDNVQHPVTGRLITTTAYKFRIDKNLGAILDFLPPGTMQGKLLLGAKVNENGHTIVWAEQLLNGYEFVTKSGELVTTKDKKLLVIGNDEEFQVHLEEAEKTGNDRVLDRFIGYKLKLEDFKKSGYEWLKQVKIKNEFLFEELVEKLVCNKQYGAVSAYRQALKILRKL
jgi:hypothetical protein